MMPLLFHKNFIVMFMRWFIDFINKLENGAYEDKTNHWKMFARTLAEIRVNRNSILSEFIKRNWQFVEKGLLFIHINLKYFSFSTEIIFNYIQIMWSHFAVKGKHLIQESLFVLPFKNNILVDDRTILEGVLQTVGINWFGKFAREGHQPISVRSIPVYLPEQGKWDKVWP